MKGYPSWFSTTFLNFIVLILFVSGVLLIPTMMVLRMDWDVPEIYLIKNRLFIVFIHTLFAFIMCFVIGALWSVHMRCAWRRKKNRWSGGIQTFLWFLLFVTGIGVFYLSHETLSQWNSLFHSLLGILILISYFVHIHLARKHETEH